MQDSKHQVADIKVLHEKAKKSDYEYIFNFLEKCSPEEYININQTVAGNRLIDIAAGQYKAGKISIDIINKLRFEGSCEPAVGISTDNVIYRLDVIDKKEVKLDGTIQYKQRLESDPNNKENAPKIKKKLLDLFPEAITNTQQIVNNFLKDQKNSELYNKKIEQKKENHDIDSYFSSWSWFTKYQDFGANSSQNFKGHKTLSDAVTALMKGTDVQLPEVFAASILLMEQNNKEILLDGLINFLKDFHRCNGGTLINILYVTQCEIIPDNNIYQHKQFIADFISPLEKAMHRIQTLFQERANHAIAKWYDDRRNKALSKQSIEQWSYETMKIEGITKEEFYYAQNLHLDNIEGNNDSFHYIEGYESTMMSEFLSSLIKYNTGKWNDKTSKLQKLIEPYSNAVRSGYEDIKNERIKSFYQIVKKMAQDVIAFDYGKIKAYTSNRKDYLLSQAQPILQDESLELKLSGEQIIHDIEQTLDENRAICFMENLLRIGSLILPDKVCSMFQTYIDQKLAARQLALNSILKLIDEGNSRIPASCEQGILLLGDTGAGKSTLAHALVGRDLKSFYDNDKGIFKIDAVEPLGTIRISHNKTSETKIPNRCEVENLLIWDCPGFNDTDVAQQITNSFYIMKLITNTNRLKFVLVTTESSITQGKGNLFVNVVSQLVNSFETITALKNSVFLIVTQARPGKKAIHLKNELNSILQDNNLLAANVREMIGYLANSIALYHEPTAETALLPKSDLFSCISNNLDFIANTSIGANMSLSSKAKAYAINLAYTSYLNFKQMLEVLENAVKNSKDCLTINKNIFVKAYPLFNQWLPHNIKNTNTSYPAKDNIHSDFLEIAQLYKLKKALEKLSKTSPSTDIVKTLRLVLAIFRDSVIGDENSNSDEINRVKQQVDNYAYIIDHQIEYLKFFQDLAKTETDYQKHLLSTLENCKRLIVQKFNGQIKLIQLNENNTEASYYQEAIKYLEAYAEETECRKKLVQANLSLANMNFDSAKSNAALTYYVAALKYNKTLPQVYEKIGDILERNRKYIEALNCYKVADQRRKVKDCYKKLVKASPQDLKLLEERGDFFDSIGEIEKAKACYNDASGLTYDLTIKNALEDKIALAESKKYKKKDKFYDFDSINLAQLIALADEIDTIKVKEVQQSLKEPYANNGFFKSEHLSAAKLAQHNKVMSGEVQTKPDVETSSSSSGEFYIDEEEYDSFPSPN